MGTVFLACRRQPGRADAAASLAQDELTTTKRSYEDQLSMMSDHLCSMNETLSKQREEIDTLKLGSKVGKSFRFRSLSMVRSLSVNISRGINVKAR